MVVGLPVSLRTRDGQLRVPVRRASPVRFDRHTSVAAEDQVGGDPRDGHYGGNGVARDLHRKNGRVDHAEPVDASDAQLEVHDVVTVRAHGACPDGVVAA
jgi:hypothetical protein